MNTRIKCDVLCCSQRDTQGFCECESIRLQPCEHDNAIIVVCSEFREVKGGD